MNLQKPIVSITNDQNILWIMPKSFVTNDENIGKELNGNVKVMV
jgi:hypothetical protein